MMVKNSTFDKDGLVTLEGRKYGKGKNFGWYYIYLVLVSWNGSCKQVRVTGNYT